MIWITSRSLLLYCEDTVKRSQCEAWDYGPTSVYESQDCPGVPDRQTWKPQLIDQQCAVYHFKCDQCNTGYIRYTTDICLYAWMDIEARLCQFENIMTINKKAQFWMTSTVVLKCWKNAKTSLIASLIKQLWPCLNICSQTQFELRSYCIFT